MLGWANGKNKRKKRGQFDITDIIGHVIMCEDNVFRRVISVTEPMNRYAAKSGYVIVNENDPGSNAGYWAHCLTITNALMGLTPPSKESKLAASRLWRSMVMMDAKDLHNKQVKGELPFDFSD